MRIKVVTSINVRSSPFASPRVVVQDAFPDPDGDAILGKISSALRSLSPDQHPRMDRLIASQRIPRGSRLSGWLHGSSVRNNDRRRPSNHTRNTSHTRYVHFRITFPLMWATPQLARYVPRARSLRNPFGSSYYLDFCLEKAMLTA